MLDDRTANLLLAGFVGALAIGSLAIPTHPFSGSLIGHAVGVAGATLMACALIYPFRKRVLKKKGRKNPIGSHIFFGSIGPTLVLLHAGNEPASPIGLLIYMSLLLIVFSGIVGRFLFKKVNRSVKEHTAELDQLHELLELKRRDVTPEDLKAFLEAETGSQPDARQCQSCQELRDVALSIAEGEHTLAVFDRTKWLFTRWSMVHRYLTTLLFALLAVHILVTMYYGLRWLP
ncbi:MAG: hypothetical protein KQI62_03810 [Deltaproteobacteria bacterium]|nr:hypothetical protein [Deltaproteobacteria bacterium]